MKITAKGQVTTSFEIRRKLGLLTPNFEPGTLNGRKGPRKGDTYGFRHQ
jgi:hypothetical protein